MVRSFCECGTGHLGVFDSYIGVWIDFRLVGSHSIEVVLFRKRGNTPDTL